MSGTFRNLKVLNSPAQAFAVLDTGPLLMSELVIDNSLGDLPNEKSNGQAAGRNTDGFDVIANDLTIQNSFVHNQDDCLAINGGSNILFQNNTCHRGHGISIAVSSGAQVTNVAIIGNTITESDQALRIKTVKTAKGSKVSNITYTGNTASGCKRFGVLIDQSYPNVLGKPGTGVHVEDINFIGSSTTISVDSTGRNVAVNCGRGTCTGSWDWSQLNVAGGQTGLLRGAPSIKGSL